MTKSQNKRISQVLSGVIDQELRKNSNLKKLLIAKKYPKEFRTIQRVLGVYNGE